MLHQQLYESRADEAVRAAAPRPLKYTAFSAACVILGNCVQLQQPTKSSQWLPSIAFVIILVSTLSLPQKMTLGLQAPQ